MLIIYETTSMYTARCRPILLQLDGCSIFEENSDIQTGLRAQMIMTFHQLTMS